MDKIKRVVISILVSMTCYAHADLCSQIRGNWQGIYTIKDPILCELFNGCIHKIKAEVAYPPTDLLNNTTYEVNVNPSAGVGGIFEITCDNGVISPPYGFNGTISASCDSTSHCVAVYDDPKLLCEMAKNELN